MASSSSLSPTRADRTLRLFLRNITKLRDSGMAHRVIEDDHFDGATITLDGQVLRNFGLCSYLSLCDDPRLKEAGIEAIRAYGTSFSSSITYSSLPLYTELRERMEKIFDAHVVLTGTTTLGHLSALPVLIRSGDVVFVDQQTHTSVLTATQGLQVSGIPVTPLPHNDMEALEEAIKQDVGEGRIWYLTDGVFSMHGDSSPAASLRALLERYPRLHIYCDDAHGFGWDGPNGRGHFLEKFGEWHDRLVVIVGLSKSFGSLGGAIATPNEGFADLIRLCGPASMFGGPIPPASLGAGVAAADILLSDEYEEMRRGLMERIDRVNETAARLGLEFMSTEQTPLWFHDVGRMEDMLSLLTSMRDAGFYLNGSGFPAVPHGHAGIRFTVTLDNSLEDIDDMLMTLNEKRLELFGETEIVIDLEEVGSTSALGDEERIG